MTQPFEYLARSYEASPDAVAISSVDHDVTYRELFNDTMRIARVLRDHGVRPGDVVLINAPKLTYLKITQALFHEACVGAMLPAGFSTTDHDGVDWVISDTPVPGFPSKQHISIDDSFFTLVDQASSEPDPKSYENEDSVFQIIYSSGTTGRPKAVEIPISRMNIRGFELRHEWMIGNPLFCFLGPASMLTFVVFVSQIAHGETFLLIGEDDDVFDQIIRWNIEAIIASPHQLGIFANLAAKDTRALPSLTTIGSIGAALPDSLGAVLEKRFQAHVVSLYGSSEGGIIARRDGLGSESGLAGRILDGIDVRITDESGVVLPEGEVGLIGVKRANQPQRYVNDVEATARAFRDGYFYAGDVGYVRDRDLYLAGREDELINAAGAKVDPARIEITAMDFPGITDAGAFGVTTSQGLKIVALAFVPGVGFDGQGFVEFMNTKLGDSTPRQYLQVGRIPRTADTGKVMREKLAILLDEEPAVEAPEVEEPRRRKRWFR